MVREIKFSYEHADGPVYGYDEPSVVRLSHGLYFTLWSCGKTCFFTVNHFGSGQTGCVSACLVEQAINAATPAEVHKWEVQRKDLYHLFNDVAAIIGREMTAESRRNLAALLSRSFA